MRQKPELICISATMILILHEDFELTIFTLETFQNEDSAIGTHQDQKSRNRQAYSNNSVSQSITVRGVMQIWDNVFRCSKGRPIENCLLLLWR